MPRFDCTTAAGIRDAIAQTHRSDTLSRAWSLTYYRLYPGPLNEAIIKKLSEDIGDPFPFLKLPEDQRRVVLGFLLGVAWRPSPPPPPPSFFMAPVLPDRRVRFSALASIRTLTFHSRSIKAVCSAVATDVRVLERTVARPGAWLTALWGITPHPGMQHLAMDYGLAACRERAEVAGRGNLALEVYSRLKPQRRSRVVSFKTPSHWPKKRTDAIKKYYAEHQREYEGREAHRRLQPHDPREFVWAHVRVRPAEEMLAMTPVDPTLLRTLYRTAFRSFVEGLRERTWTLLVSKVTISCPLSVRRSDATDEDHDALEAGLAAFFGADKMREAPWVQAWANKSAISYEEVKRKQYDPSHWHDVSRPPVTRIRDIRDDTGFDSFVQLTEDDCATAATIDIAFDDDASFDVDTGYVKERATLEIGPVLSARCRTGSQDSTDSRFQIEISPAAHREDEPIAAPAHFEALRTKNLDSASLFMPIVDGVFNVVCECRIAGLS